jgi:nucleotide-binding universal stress UspA family protein
MYQKILVATDGSELAGHAVEHGLQLAQSVGASVVFVMVTELWHALEIARTIEGGKQDAVEIYEDAAAQSAKGVLDDAMARAKAMGVESDSRHVKDRKPAEGIMSVAGEEDCDLIVMASHGRRGIEKMLIGSQTAEVISRGKHPVLVLR